MADNRTLGSAVQPSGFGASVATSPSWAENVRRWSAFLSVQGLSQTTIRGYRRTLIRFVADTLLDLDGVTEDDVITYIAAMPRNGSARGDALRALRSYYGWAEQRDQFVVSPVRRLKPKNPKYGDAPTLERDDLVRVLFALAWREPRRAWTALLLYSTGARIASACALRPEDVYAGRIHLTYQVKGDRPYSLPLARTSAAAVEGLRAAMRTGQERLIGVSPTRVRQWLDRAELDTGLALWPHLFRHAFGTTLAPLTDPRTWMEAMNHQDLSQYRRYAHASDERLRAAIDGL